MLTISKDNVGVVEAADGWQEYVKVTPTRMVRMTRPFACETKEGLVECEDGFLAIDAEGFPYPVAKTIHDKTYKLKPESKFPLMECNPPRAAHGAK
jgi:hypothetical protein